ncbi:RNA polymerase II transcription elongation factor-domain-containing protein [Thelonectria olida]|uniref:RNA polymerase II transcription elongation factor-domain-containing protein n=1 Tax=Thelonectria olida TaxID=1576542 RepID=A0A9P9AL47_9HYPO|nr:RNA polymerase II transcription elongation factor-domain-containing protein [Thelonectria olida]
MAGLIDPTKTGKYPVILGDSLRGKTVNEVFTAIRYNHKPTLSSASAPNSARLRPSTPGKTSSYDLTYADNGQKYAFTGPRNTDENQYVLYFNPTKKAFVLDKVDSTFNMNATRLPGNSDPESLRRQHPHIDNTPRPAPAPASKASKPAAAAAKSAPLKPPPKPRAKSVLPTKKKELPTQRKKPEKKAPAKPISLALPVAEPQQEKEKEKEKEKPKGDEFDYEDEDEDDDGGLLVEYPDGDPVKVASRTDFSPAFTSVRRFDDFMNQRESEGDDGDSDDLDPKTNDIEFPSMHVDVNQFQQQQHQPGPEPDAMDEDLEDELAKEMEIAFEGLENSLEPSLDPGDESEISEED